MTDFRDASWWPCTSDEYFASAVPGSTALHKVLTGAAGPAREAGDMGHAVHLAVFEPDVFESRVVVKPAEVSRGSGAGQKDREAKWLAEHKGKLVLTEREHNDCIDIQNAVMEHPATAKLMQHSGKRLEAAMRGTDVESGLAVKGRCDFFLGNLIVDLKTADDPTPHTWIKSVHAYGYDLQAALYRGLVQAIRKGEATKFAWLVVGKRPPFRIAFLECPAEWMQLGWRKMRCALDLLDYDRDLKRPPLYYEGVMAPLPEPAPWNVTDVERWEAHRDERRKRAGR